VLESLFIPVLLNPNQGLSLSGGVAVGLIEELCKIVAVAFMARGMRHTAPMDGLLLGAAVGMGFAAFESTGYAFTAFVATNGHVVALIAETILRGVIAPFGHSIWTAILAAVLFRESRPHHFRITGLVIVTYLFVSLLHGFWDGLPRTIYLLVPPGFHILLVTLALSVIGIVVFAVIYRRATVQTISPPTPVNP
jgi:RsiW-degrading membrane proteinase PrsW (M82 family)